MIDNRTIDKIEANIHPMIIFRRRQKGGGLLMRADTKVNMCQAIREMREEERMKGKSMEGR